MMDSAGQIINSIKVLEKMSSEKLAGILESDLHGKQNKKWATEILAVRSVKGEADKTKVRSTEMTLFDNAKNREEIEICEKIEVMASDVDNDSQPFWDDLDNFIQWGKKYRLTLEEIV